MKMIICLFSIDATFSKRMGRYVNDAASSNPACNANMVKVFVDYRPYLALFAKRCIQAGEEIRYDYGVDGLPWRCEKVSLGIIYPQLLDRICFMIQW
jgi:hypothetical protein